MITDEDDFEEQNDIKEQVEPHSRAKELKPRSCCLGAVKTGSNNR